MAKYSLLEQARFPDRRQLTAAQLLALKQQSQLPRPHWATQSYQQLEQQVEHLQDELLQLSAQRHAELEQQEMLAQQLSSLLGILPVGVLVLDHHGRVRSANPAAHAILGLESLSLEGQPWLLLAQMAICPKADDGHEISLHNNKRVSIATQALPDQGQLVVIHDQTQTRALQAQVSRDQRLAEMGRMVASLAHQIRTPLASATLYVGNLLRFQPEPEQQQQFLLRIQQSLGHLEQQVRDMLMFVRGDAPRQDHILISELLADVEQQAEPTLQARGFQLQLEQQHNGMICCNKELLVGAILNLINNAMDACQPLATARVLRLRARLEQRQLQLCLCDRGQGMTAEQLAQVEQPFYTTKSTGTGLGLAVVRSVIKAHHGQMQIASQPGQGTQVSLWLPIIEETAS